MISPEELVRRARHRSHPPRHVVAFALACGRVTWECRGLRTLKRGECGATVHPGDRRGSYTEALARHRIGGRFGLRSSLSELAYLRQYASGSPRLLWPADSSGSPGPNVSESTPWGEASPRAICLAGRVPAVRPPGAHDGGGAAPAVCSPAVHGGHALIFKSLSSCAD